MFIIIYRVLDRDRVLIYKKKFNFSGCDNVMGVEFCIRYKDYVVIVMFYFLYRKF